jgi:hypothetical protein
MYSFGQREGTTICDEPFYAFYLNETGKMHPGREEILKSQPHSYYEVFRQLDGNACDLLYIKNMAHQIRLIPIEQFQAYTNVLLIRDPAQLIASFAQVIEHPDMFDIGIAEQLKIWKHYTDLGHNVVVIDSGELLNDPQKVMKELCDRIEIPFEKKMLSWSAGARPEDGIWAQYWYDNVHKSTGFAKQRTSPRPFPDKCRPLLSEALPMYNELYSYAIKSR